MKQLLFVLFVALFAVTTLNAKNGKIKYGKYLVYEGEVVKKQPQGHGSLKLLNPLDKKAYTAVITGNFDNLEVSDVNITAPNFFNISFPTGKLKVVLQNLDKKQVDITLISDSSVIKSCGKVKWYNSVYNIKELYTRDIHIKIGQPDLKQDWIVKSIGRDEVNGFFEAKYEPDYVPRNLKIMQYDTNDVKYLTDIYSLNGEILQGKGNVTWFLNDGSTYKDDVLTYNDGNKIYLLNNGTWYGTKVYDDGSSIRREYNSDLYSIRYNNGNSFEGSITNEQFSLIDKNAVTIEARYNTGTEIKGNDTIQWINGETFADRHERLKGFLTDEWIAKVESGAMTEEQVKVAIAEEEERLRQEEERRRKEEEERVRSTKVIQPEDPGTILSYISLEELKYIKHLTIIGFIYHTDIEILSECEQLESIDLSRCVITADIGTLTAKDKYDFSVYCAKILGIENAKHADYHHILRRIKKKSDVKMAFEGCLVPPGAFRNMKNLKTVILPYTASSIGVGAFDGCTDLEVVDMPPYVSKIRSSFNDCEKLKNIEFPKTVVSLQGFNNCKSLTKVDLGQCTFTNNCNWDCDVCWVKAFKGCSNLTELYLPKGVTQIGEDYPKTGNTGTLKIYLHGGLKYLNMSVFNNLTELHFLSRDDLPSRLSIGAGTPRIKVFCPKGSLTSYYSRFGKFFEVKEEQ